MAGSAAKAASAGYVAATNIGGALSPAQLPGSVVTNPQAGVVLGGTFSGDGSGLTSLSTANLTGTHSAANNFPVTLVTNLLNRPGPLPLAKSFTSHGATLIIFNSGSGYAITASTTMGIVVSLNSVNLATNKLWSNLAGTHLPLVPLTTCKTGSLPGCINSPLPP